MAYINKKNVVVFFHLLKLKFKNVNIFVKSRNYIKTSRTTITSQKIC